MDCNSYSYTAPGFGVDAPRQYTPCDRVTIERRTANGHEYYIIIDNTNSGSTKVYDLPTAIRTAQSWLMKGV